MIVCFVGSKFSFDPSIDDSSLLLECSHGGSKRSLAGTSVTSTADLSVFSTATRSQFLDNSLDTHSNVSDGSGGAVSIGGSCLPGRGSESLKISSAHSTPRTTPHVPSSDVVRIYVPYSPSSPTPTSSPQNGLLTKSFVDDIEDMDREDDLHIRYNTDDQQQTASVISQEDNKITIKVDTGQDDAKTPVVEFGHFVVPMIPSTSKIN